MQKIALIGDSHGNYQALKAVLKDAQKQNVDNYIVLGDITNRGPEPFECVTALQQVHPLAWIIGNHEDVYRSLLNHEFHGFEDNPKAIMAIITSQYDRQQLGQKQFEWLSQLPLKREITVENLKLLLFHSTPQKCRGSFSYPTNEQTNFDALMAESDADIGIYGHTHRFILRMTNDGRYLFNPGSVGMPVSDRLSISGKASYGIITIDDRSVLSWDQRNVPYDLDQELRVAQKRNLPYLGLYKELLQTGKFTFNREKVAAENQKNGYLKQALAAVNKVIW